MSERILVIDDNETMRDGVSAILKKENKEVFCASNGREGIELFRQHFPDFVITDLKMDQMDGLEVIRQIKGIYPDAIIMVMTAFGSIEFAVEAMKLGAFDFITKPFPGDLLKIKVQQGLRVAKMNQENVFYRSEMEVETNRPIIGSHPKMKGLQGQICKIAQTDSTVLILGESGTGKELIARELHRQSKRNQSAFVKTDCASLAPGVLESELFGHEKGSFTGAIARKLGRFEMANGGTIFLDEIGEISNDIQLRLLRVLQDRCFERVGGTKPIHVDVRIISATHKDLKAEVAAGRFREDLFYRLNIVPLQVPSLRERLEDIPELISFLLKKIGKKLGREMSLSIEAMSVLMQYPWPGNVRELENVIERTVILAPGTQIGIDDLPKDLHQNPQKPTHPEVATHQNEEFSLTEALEKLEKSMILNAYAKTDGVKTKMAEVLGIKPSALYYKLEKYGIK